MIRYIFDLVTAVVSFALALALYRPFIGWLRSRRAGQVIQEELPPEHQRKAGTPTGGGMLFIALGVLGGLLATVGGHRGALPAVAALLLGGLLGLADDLAKLRVGSIGIPARAKFPIQLLLALPVAWLAYQPHQWPLPFDLPAWAYYPLAVIAITGCANAVNLTDGIDGQLGGAGLIGLCFLVFGLGDGGGGERAVAMALAGGMLGFLVYNRHPARVFMGDTGSLGLGFALAAMALQQGAVLALPVLGFLFVVEAVSVIMQVAYFKATGGRRIFKMAPIHLTFQLSGWPETRIVALAYAVALAGALAALGLRLWLPAS